MPGKEFLQVNEFLGVNEYLQSGNCAFFAVMQSDGNFCVYRGTGPADNKGALWCSRQTSAGEGRYFAVMQSDGNFCVYRGTGPADNHGYLWGTQVVDPQAGLPAVDTFGWDTVYAASIESVNRALAANPGLLLSTFSFSLPAPASYAGQGRFGAWQVVPGGSGQLLHIEIPIASGSLTHASDPAVDLGGTSAVVEVALELLPSRTEGRVSDLRFSMSSVGQTPGHTAPGVVTPIRLNDPGSKLTFTQRAVLLSALAECLAEHGADISWVFASIGPVAGTESWLNPVSTGFFYYEAPRASYLVILGVTSARDVSGLRRQVDANLLACAPQAAFAFSKELFLRNVIQPMLPGSFHHASADTFRYEPSEQSIVNTRQFDTDSVKSGAIWYSPHIDGLKVTTEGSTLTTSVHGSCDMGMGITLTFGIQSRNEVGTDLAKGTVTFADDPHPTTTHHASIPWYDWFLGPLPDLLMAIIVPVVADGIAGGLNSHAGQIAVADAPPPSIRWTGLAGFQATSAGLNNSFSLRGRLATVPADAGRRRT